MPERQFLRKVKLTVKGATGTLDLSSMRLRFSVKAADVETPNNASIRVYNLSNETTKQIMEEFKEMVLEAGYDFNVGVIFKGTIKQFRSGREGVDTYLDLLAADGDIAYNQAFISASVEAGTSREDRIRMLADSMKEKGLGNAEQIALSATGGIIPNPRGKVMFGMSRKIMSQEVQAADATWSIQDGELVVIQKSSYLPGEAVVLTGQSGLIGRPEQTVDGIKAKCLINPNIKVGKLVKLDNSSINTTTKADPTAASIVYNSYTALQFLANLASDGLYRVYVIEYEGDTRGSAWYSELTLLEVNPAEGLVVIE